MNIYFEEGQQVTDEILKTMEASAKYCLELEGIDDDSIFSIYAFPKAPRATVNTALSMGTAPSRTAFSGCRIVNFSEPAE